MTKVHIKKDYDFEVPNHTKRVVMAFKAGTEDNIPHTWVEELKNKGVIDVINDNIKSKS